MAFYHPLTLGVRRSRPSEASRALSKGPLADLSYEMWREGLARLDICYEEYPEARVLEAVRRAAAHASLDKHKHLQEGSAELADMLVSLPKLFMEPHPRNSLRLGIRYSVQPLRQPTVYIHSKS